MSGFRFESAITRVTFSGYIRLPRRVTHGETDNPAPVCMRRYVGRIVSPFGRIVSPFGRIVSPFAQDVCECGYSIALHEIYRGTFTVPDEAAEDALLRYIAAVAPIEEVEIVRDFDAR